LRAEGRGFGGADLQYSVRRDLGNRTLQGGEAERFIGELVRQGVQWGTGHHQECWGIKRRVEERLVERNNLGALEEVGTYLG